MLKCFTVLKKKSTPNATELKAWFDCVVIVSLGVGTQGGNKDSWVTLYTLEWSEEGESWETYQEDSHDKVLMCGSFVSVCIFSVHFCYKSLIPLFLWSEPLHTLNKNVLSKVTE